MFAHTHGQIIDTDWLAQVNIVDSFIEGETIAEEADEIVA